MIEKTYQYNNKITVDYKLKSATADKKHLVVIFTGFMADYNYEGSGSRLKSNVLWIKDSYNGYECYYVGQNGRLDYELAVNSLIENVLLSLGLSKEQCTLFGGSKGGYGALYIGIKYNYKNIISIAPLTKIGTRLQLAWPEHARLLMGENYSKSTIDKYDNILSTAINEDINPHKNIYLILSQDDQFYKEHQEFLPGMLEKFYKNFNLFSIKSNLIYQHNRMGEYNLPLAFMLINSLIEDINPCYGRVLLKSKENVISYGINEPTAFLKRCRFVGNHLHLSGVAFFRGVNVSSYGVYRKILLLTDGSNKYQYTIGTTLDKSISHAYYEGGYVDYSAGGFADIKGRGLDLMTLPLGVYKMDVVLSTPSIKSTSTALLSERSVDVKAIFHGYEYRIWDKNNQLFLSKRKIFALPLSSEKKPLFNLTDLRINDNRLFITGTFAVPGIELLNWGDARYYLVLLKGDDVYSFSLGLLNRLSNNSLLEDGFGVYQKAAFGTIRMQGIDISHLSVGIYDIYVVLSYKGSLFKRLVDKKVRYSNEVIELL